MVRKRSSERYRRGEIPPGEERDTGAPKAAAPAAEESPKEEEITPQVPPKLSCMGQATSEPLRRQVDAAAPHPYVLSEGSEMNHL